MEAEKFLEILHVAEKLKCITRHSDTSTGRRESVAEHCWRVSLMALLCENEFPDADILKVLKMCIIHDLGEAFTGDIAAFRKTDDDRARESECYNQWISSFPQPQKQQFQALLSEMETLETQEGKLYKALDKLEAVIQHNESDISSWIPLEYELQLTYGKENVEFSPYLKNLKDYIDCQTKEKIERGK